VHSCFFHQADELIKGLDMFFVPPQEEWNLNPRSQLNLSPISPADSTPIMDNSSQALWEQAEKHPINGETRFDIAAPLACNAAENQVAKQNATEVSEDLKFSLKQLLLLLLL
jgi:hypothetical protein